MVRHGVATHSDHLLMWFETEEVEVRGKKDKQPRFEVKWVGDDNCS